MFNYLISEIIALINAVSFFSEVTSLPATTEQINIILLSKKNFYVENLVKFHIFIKKSII